MKIKTGDNVLVVLGKDNGKTAKVTRVLPKKNKIFVEGVNIYKRHISGKKQGVNEGGILDIQKPLDISNVMLICPKCKKPTRVGFKQTDKEKISGASSKVRICRKCGKELNEQTKK